MFILVKRTNAGLETQKVAKTVHEMATILDGYDIDDFDYWVVMLNRAMQKEVDRAGMYMRTYEWDDFSHYFPIPQWYKIFC
jgi:uncharacterized protein YqgV (UPF0045/DUF77 family)